jgi:hypothetical protein
VRDALGRRRGHAVRGEAVRERVRQRHRETEDHQREEDPDREDLRRVLERLVHAAAGAPVLRGQAVHHAGAIRRRECAHADAHQEQDDREHGIGEVDREQLEQDEARGGQEHPAGRERPRPEAIREDPGDGPRDEESERQRQHPDARPERRRGKAVAVLRQPDPLQPDDQHEHQAAARDRREEAREHAERERADAEEAESEHRVRGARLDGDEDREQREAGGDAREHEGRVPAHGLRAVRADAVRDPDHDEDEPAGERKVPRPVDRRTAPGADLAQPPARPDGAEEPERDRDEEDQPPRDRREQPAEHEPEELAADPDDVVDPEGEPALVGRERVGEDRRGVGDQERRADPLHDPEDDQPVGPRPAAHPVDRQEQRRDGVDDEAERVHAHAPVEVAQAAEADDQHARHDEEAEDHPEEVEAVAGLQRIEVDAAEDVGHGDQDDRRVDGREQHAERGVRERDPLVVHPPHRRIYTGKLLRLPA